jgi:hypothetical protein
MTKLNALIIGESRDLTFILPYLLFRSGFNVDLITTNALFKKSRFITNLELVDDRNLIPIKAVEKNPDNYDFIIISDDVTLSLIADSDISLANKLKLLPIQDEVNFQHVYSKIGLSKVLSQANISTPDFIAAKGIDEVVLAAEKLTYPVMVKMNSEGGGNGVFECGMIEDINKLPSAIFNSPLLVQKKIIGTELDLSALYRDGKLICSSYSQIQQVIANKFGPSSVRLYKQLDIVDKKILLEMQNLGKALGANGFVTISCIESNDDNKRYFIEADMRPNTWVEFAKFIGDDPAIRIANWFKNGETLNSFVTNKKYPTQIIMPYFLRLTASEIFYNRYNVWKYLPIAEYKMLTEVLYDKLIRDNQKIITFKSELKILFLALKRLYRHPKLLFKPFLSPKV